MTRALLPSAPPGALPGLDLRQASWMPSWSATSAAVCGLCAMDEEAGASTKE